MNIHIMEPKKQEKIYPILGRDAEGNPYIKFGRKDLWFDLRYGLFCNESNHQIRELEPTASVTLTQQ